jgi:hypothetical protein
MVDQGVYPQYNRKWRDDSNFTKEYPLEILNRKGVRQIEKVDSAGMRDKCIGVSDSKYCNAG